MKKKMLNLVLFTAMVLTMASMMVSLSYAEASDPATTFIVNTADDEYLTFTVDDAGTISGHNDQNEPVSLPSGVGWDNTEKAVILNDFTGKRIASRDTGKELRIKLLNVNKLTGYGESGEICGIFTEHAGIRILSSSTGTLGINIGNSTDSRYVRAIMTSGYSYNRDEINIDGGTVDISVNTTGSFANGIYGGKVSVNNNADLNIEMYSRADDIDRVYDIYGEPYFNTSGTVSLVTNDDCIGSNSAYISGTGNYYLLSLGNGKVWDDSSKFTYGNGRSESDYAVYGSENERACAVLGNTSVLTETEKPSVPLPMPETDSWSLTWAMSLQYIRYIKWTPDDDRFAPFTEYTADIHLVPMPGYRLGTYTAADFADEIEGETSLSYANGVITAGFPETGDTSLEIIDTTFAMEQPAAGKPMQKSIENADCTGTVVWSVNGGYANPDEAFENTVYTATVTLQLKDGVDKRFSGIPADSYTVTGANVTEASNDAGSKVFRVTFPATGKAHVNAVVNGMECNENTDYSQFGGKVTYDAADHALVLNGYSGGSIVNKYTGAPLRIRFKGENSIACEYTSLVSECAGIYSCGGDVFLTGADGAAVNIACENTSSYSPRGLFSFNSTGDFIIDNVKVNIDLKQIENETQVMTGIYGETRLRNGASVNIDVTSNANGWCSSFDDDITIADDSSWKPVYARILPASDRHGSIRFADTALAEKYAVKDVPGTGMVLTALKDISRWDAELEDTVFALEAGGVTPAFTGLDGLAEGEDYTISYENNYAAGAASATLTGRGDFTGSITKQFRIIPSFSMEDYAVSLGTSAVTYNGNLQKPSVSVAGLKAGEDYTVSYSDNRNAGTGKVTVNGTGKLSGSVTKTFTIEPASIGGKTAKLSATKYVYSGSARKPSVTVSGLVKGTDFTAAYKNNTKVGKATVSITGKGNYRGALTRTFKIIPKQASVYSLTSGRNKVTVKMKTRVASTGGATYQIAYKQKGTSKWKYTTTAKQSKTISKLRKGKRYYVKVRAYKTVANVKYYGAWSKTKLSRKIK